MKHVLRILAVIGTFLGTFILAVCIAVVIIMKGPSHSAAELFTLSLKETSALKWIPDIFFSDEEIQQIVDNNSVKATDETTNTDLIDTTDTASQDIEIYEISGPTYIGDVMLIKDPSRLFVGNKGPYDGSGGTTVDVIAARYDAVAGINGGGFYDAGRDSSQGYIDGLLSKARQIASSAADMVRNALNAARNAIDSHSPSRAYERLGEDSDQGYINGVQKRAGRVNSALDTLARDAMGAFYEGLTRANDAATDEFAITPTVSPVMDLNGVYGGVDYLRNVFNGAGSVLGSITADVDNNIADIRELVVNTRQILASLKGRKPITIDGRTVIGWVDTELGAL